MSENQVIHFVEADARVRADLARAAFSLGHHTEVYADLAELCDRPPQRGIVVIRDSSKFGGVVAAIGELGRSGIWLPVVAMDEAPETGRIIAAVKAGVLDYLTLPLTTERLAEMLERIDEEARMHCETQRRVIEARSRINNLSAREREVLDWIAQGSTNKSIARQLDISPRTVEVHRANLMVKLGASHTADAVRIYLQGNL